MTKKEVKQNRRRKKLFLAILMILFTGVLLTTSTYAWFTANKTVTVSQIDVNVAAENGLQLSVDGTNWKPVITNADIDAAISTYPTAVNQLPKKANSIVPVSTAGIVDGATGFLNMYAGSIETKDDHYILTTQKSTETNTSNSGQFIAFDLFFRTTSDAQIYLSDASHVRNLEGANGLQNAARIAFLTQGHAAIGTELSSIQTMKASDATGLMVWEPNYDVHTDSGVKNALDNYQISTSKTGGSQLEYVGVKAEIAAGDDVRLNSKDTKYFGAIKPGLATTEAGIPKSDYLDVFKLSAGITKIRVYMWIEGQDVDCENDASGSTISFNLQFTMNEKGE